jgi:hypothetical protein
MAAERCLLVILGKKIDIVMLNEVPLAGGVIAGESFKPINFGAEDYFFDWLISMNGEVIGISFFSKNVLPVIGILPSFENLESDSNSGWTNIYFSRKNEIDNTQSFAQQNLNTLLLKSDRNRFALTFPVFDYDLQPPARKSLDKLFPILTILT